MLRRSGCARCQFKPRPLATSYLSLEIYNSPLVTSRQHWYWCRPTCHRFRTMYSASSEAPAAMARSVDCSEPPSSSLYSKMMKYALVAAVLLMAGCEEYQAPFAPSAACEGGGNLKDDVRSKPVDESAPPPTPGPDRPPPAPPPVGQPAGFCDD